MEETEEEGKPIERPTVSANMGDRYISDPEPPASQHRATDMRPPVHIQQRTTASGLSQRRCT